MAASGVTLQWYSSKLDFALDRQFVVDGTTFAFSVSGGVKIELVAGASQRDETPTDDLLASLDSERLHHFCIAVEDLDATITDNIGNIIELAEPEVHV